MNKSKLYSNRILYEAELIQRRDRHIDLVNVRLCRPPACICELNGESCLAEIQAHQQDTCSRVQPIVSQGVPAPVQ